jgi:hypothetical protein
MTLRCPYRCLALSLLLASAGCTSFAPPQGSLLSRMSPRQTEPEQADDEESRDLARSASQRERTESSLASLERTPPSPPQLDAATLMLIETELRDLPADERQEWTEYLRTVEPGMVPYILQSRRMAMSSQSPGVAGQTARMADRSTSSTPVVAANQGQLPMTAAGRDAAPSSAGSFRYSGTAADQSGRVPRNAPEPTQIVPYRSGVTPFGQNAVVQPSAYNGGTTPEGVYQAAGTSQVNYPAAQFPAANDLPLISPGNVGAERQPVPPVNMGTTQTPPVWGNVQTPAVSTAPQGNYLQEELQRLIALYQAEAAAVQPGLSDAERLEYVRRHVYLRMLYLIGEQPQLAQQTVPGLSPSDQEFWTELFWALSSYFDAQTVPDATERASMTVAQLSSAQRHLQHAARLELRNVTFCYKINSFGSFDRYERDEFRAGQPVLLYAEVRNFTSEPAESGLYRTRLASHIEIRRGSAQGEAVEANEFPATEDLCRNLRTDYFHSYKIDLPQHLAPGPYTLVLSVQDELTGKVSSQAINFLIR